MPRPDEPDNTWINGRVSHDEMHDYWHDKPEPERTDSGPLTLTWVIPGIIFCVLFWWFVAPAALSFFTPDVNGCDQYRAEMVACAEASR